MLEGQLHEKLPKPTQGQCLEDSTVDYEIRPSARSRYRAKVLAPQAEHVKAGRHGENRHEYNPENST